MVIGLLKPMVFFIVLYHFMSSAAFGMEADELDLITLTKEAQFTEYQRNHRFIKVEPSTLDRTQSQDEECEVDSRFSGLTRRVYSFFWIDQRGCPICFDPKISSEDRIHFSCGEITCRECATHYYQAKVDEGEADLTCLFPNCHQTISKSLALSLLDKEFQSKLRRNQVNRKLSTIPRSHRTDCNTLGCPGILVKTSDNDDQFIYQCPICFIYYCFKCKDNHSLDEHRSTKNRLNRWVKRNFFRPTKTDELDSDELENAKRLGYEIHKCPFCDTPAAKDEACNRVQCTHCRREYNWQHESEWLGYEVERQRNRLH